MTSGVSCVCVCVCVGCESIARRAQLPRVLSVDESRPGRREANVRHSRSGSVRVLHSRPVFGRGEHGRFQRVRRHASSHERHWYHGQRTGARCFLLFDCRCAHHSVLFSVKSLLCWLLFCGLVIVHCTKLMAMPQYVFYICKMKCFF